LANEKAEKGHEDAKRRPKCHCADVVSAQNQSTMKHHILIQHYMFEVEFRPADKRYDV